MPRPKEFDEEEVLDKAVNLFWCKGYHATSIQNLVDCLGINRASLYDTFTDKHCLYLTTLERFLACRSAKAVAFLSEAVSAREGLSAFFDMVLQDFQTDLEAKGCFMVNASIEMAESDTEVAQLVLKNMDMIKNAFSELIRKGQSLGEISTRFEAETMAHFLLNTLNGMKVMAKSRPEKSILEQIVKVALSTVFTP